MLDLAREMIKTPLGAEALISTGMSRHAHKLICAVGENKVLEKATKRKKNEDVGFVDKFRRFFFLFFPF